MSTPITPTEAHKDLWRQLTTMALDYLRSSIYSFSHDDRAIQLIAESEARALSAVCARHNAVIAERDELRKQVDWLQLNNDMLTDNPEAHQRAIADRQAIIAERDQLRAELAAQTEIAAGHSASLERQDKEYHQLRAECERLTSVARRLEETIDGTEEMLGGLNQGEGYWDMVRRVVGTAARAEKAEAELAMKIDTLDLMRDEFLRIKACTVCHPHNAFAEEIADLCDRAITNLLQRVPVIVQRDKAEAELSAERELVDWLASGAMPNDIFIDRDPGSGELSFVIRLWPKTGPGPEYAAQTLRAAIRKAMNEHQHEQGTD